METHLLNGDALREKLLAAHWPGQLLPLRECLLEGPVASHSWPDFWARRAAYLAATYPAATSPADYQQQTVAVLAQLPPAGPQAINLWFEDDLFCQVNLWFALHYLADHHLPNPLYRVFPPAGSWQGFGPLAAPDLRRCYAQRVPLTPADRQLGQQLWLAYVAQDAARLLALAATPTAAFRQLPAVVQAHLERWAPTGLLNRPQRTLRALQQQGLVEFEPLFRAFSAAEGIYGYGDTQVQQLLAAMPPG